MTNIPLKFILVFVTVSSFFGCLCGLQPQKSTTGFGVVSTPQLYGRSLETNTMRPDASSQTGRTFVPISQPYVLTSSGTDARLSSRSAKTWMLPTITSRNWSCSIERTKQVDGPQHSTHWSPGWFLRLELAYKQLGAANMNASGRCEPCAGGVSLAWKPCLDLCSWCTKSGPQTLQSAWRCTCQRSWQ